MVGKILPIVVLALIALFFESGECAGDSRDLDENHVRSVCGENATMMCVCDFTCRSGSDSPCSWILTCRAHNQERNAPRNSMNELPIFLLPNYDKNSCLDINERSKTKENCCDLFCEAKENHCKKNKCCPKPTKPCAPNKPPPKPTKPCKPNKPSPKPSKPCKPNKPSPKPSKPCKPNNSTPKPKKKKHKKRVVHRVHRVHRTHCSQPKKPCS